MAAGRPRNGGRALGHTLIIAAINVNVCVARMGGQGPRLQAWIHALVHGSNGPVQGVVRVPVQWINIKVQS
jgi:hypothetical protein